MHDVGVEESEVCVGAMGMQKLAGGLLGVYGDTMLFSSSESRARARQIMTPQREYPIFSPVSSLREAKTQPNHLPRARICCPFEIERSCASFVVCFTESAHISSKPQSVDWSAWPSCSPL